MLPGEKVILQHVQHAVLGDIRTACCQARLLMRQKLKQYIGLVDMAEDSTEGKKPTSEDLQVPVTCSIIA